MYKKQNNKKGTTPRRQKDREEEEERSRKEKEKEEEEEKERKQKEEKKRDDRKPRRRGKEKPASDDEEQKKDKEKSFEDSNGYASNKKHDKDNEASGDEEEAEREEEQDEDKYSDNEREDNSDENNRDDDEEEEQENSGSENEGSENSYDDRRDGDDGPARKDTLSTGTYPRKSRASKGSTSKMSDRSWALHRSDGDEDVMESEERDSSRFQYLGPSGPALIQADDRFEDLGNEGRAPPADPPEPEEPAPRDGKICDFFVNGDISSKCVPFTINKKVRSFDTLMSELEHRCKAPCRFIFSIPTGRKITKLEDFIHKRQYVVSGPNQKKYTPLEYGSGTSKWSNRPISTKAGKLRNAELGLLAKDAPLPGGKPHGKYKKGEMRPPRLTMITNNTNRGCRAKVVINPNTTQMFEEVLAEMGAMVDVTPTVALYTAKAPFIRVKSFSHLFSEELRNVDSFLVCGEENLPPEMKHQKDVTDEWVEKSKDQKYRKQRDSADASSVQGVGRYIGIEPTKDDEIDDLALKRNKKEHDAKKGKTEVAVNRKSLPQRSRDMETIRMHLKGKTREYYVPRQYMQNSPHDGSKPEQKPKLDWIYGYRGHDAANNMFVLSNGDLVYYNGTVGVVYDRKENRQLHYTGHTEEITSMAVHPTNPIVATGQVGGNPQMSSMWWPHVRVWEATGNLTTLHIIGLRVLQDGVSAVAFSGEGKGTDIGDLLMILDESDKHFMYVYKWNEGNDGLLIAKTPTTSSSYQTDLQPNSDTVVWGHFHPQDCTDIFTHGKNHLHVWKLLWNPDFKPDERSYGRNGNRKVMRAHGKLLWDKKGGLFEDVPKFVTSMTFLKTPNDDVITGDWHGRLSVFSRDDEDAYVMNKDFESAEMLSRAHRRPVFALCMVEEEGMLLSGAGNEIKAWACWDQDNPYKPIKDYERTLPNDTGNVRSIVVHGQDLIVGTTSNCILETNLAGGRWNMLVQGHSKDLYALAICPDNKTFITAGFDKQIIKWDAKRHRPQWKTEVYESATAVAVDPKNELVVVGTLCGMFSVLEAEKGDHLFSYQATQSEIDCMQFSPDGKLLAFGSRDCNVYIYKEEGGLLIKYKKCALSGHKNFVKHLDWSQDGRYLQSVTVDCDLKFWKIDSLTEEKPFQQRDFAGDTHTCIVGHNVLGPWINLEEDEEVLTMCGGRNVHDESSPMTLLAVGNNKGALRLFRYPCIHPQPAYHERRWHSGQVTNVRFIQDGTDDGEFIITTGGSDSTIMQWALEPNGSGTSRY